MFDASFCIYSHTHTFFHFSAHANVPFDVTLKFHSKIYRFLRCVSIFSVFASLGVANIVNIFVDNFSFNIFFHTFRQVLTFIICRFLYKIHLDSNAQCCGIQNPRIGFRNFVYHLIWLSFDVSISCVVHLMKMNFLCRRTCFTFSSDVCGFRWWNGGSAAAVVVVHGTVL